MHFLQCFSVLVTAVPVRSGRLETMTAVKPLLPSTRPCLNATGCRTLIPTSTSHFHSSFQKVFPLNGDIACIMVVPLSRMVIAVSLEPAAWLPRPATTRAAAAWRPRATTSTRDAPLFCSNTPLPPILDLINGPVRTPSYRSELFTSAHPPELPFEPRAASSSPSPSVPGRLTSESQSPQLAPSWGQHHHLCRTGRLASTRVSVVRPERRNGWLGRRRRQWARFRAVF